MLFLDFPLFFKNNVYHDNPVESSPFRFYGFFVLQTLIFPYKKGVEQNIFAIKYICSTRARLDDLIEIINIITLFY